MKAKNITEMRQAVKDKYYATPEQQVSVGIYIYKIGIKYVTLLNTWDGSRLVKMSIEDFYVDHF